MTYSTEANKPKRINEIRDQVSTCSDPFHLLSEVLYENERLRRENKQLKGVY